MFVTSDIHTMWRRRRLLGTAREPEDAEIFRSVIEKSPDDANSNGK